MGEFVEFVRYVLTYEAGLYVWITIFSAVILIFITYACFNLHRNYKERKMAKRQTAVRIIKPRNSDNLKNDNTNEDMENEEDANNAIKMQSFTEIEESSKYLFEALAKHKTNRNRAVNHSESAVDPTQDDYSLKFEPWTPKDQARMNSKQAILGWLPKGLSESKVELHEIEVIETYA